MKILPRLFVILASAVLAGCATPGSKSQAAASKRADGYVVIVVPVVVLPSNSDEDFPDSNIRIPGSPAARALGHHSQSERLGQTASQ